MSDYLDEVLGEALSKDADADAAEDSPSERVKEAAREAAKVMGESRRYIDSREEAPDGVTVRRGMQGGLYYYPGDVSDDDAGEGEDDGGGGDDGGSGDFDVRESIESVDPEQVARRAADKYPDDPSEGLVDVALDMADTSWDEISAEYAEGSFDALLDEAEEALGGS